MIFSTSGKLNADSAKKRAEAVFRDPYSSAESPMCRPSQDVRNEFKRLDVLSHQTTMRYGSPKQASESQQHLVEHFSPEALPAEPGREEPDEYRRQDARALARLQASSACLINGSNMRLPSAPRRPRNVQGQALIMAVPMVLHLPSCIPAVPRTTSSSVNG
ncbi:hypothetical protein B0H13DRAFT_1893302 [Mycena leptocephala]|nr:hypothetical protein B0H13DRAFT_1893302 [Mycena leptocephala]